MLKLININKSYNDQKVLKKITINLRKNEFVSILGPSGSGKTTLLNIIGGLDKYDNGELIIEGISTKKYTNENWDSYRNQKIGFIFQEYNLINHLTVLENVELASIINGKKQRKKAIALLEQLDLKKYINKLPNELSGGQKQRVAIARAIINEPSIILADEPTGALDSKTSEEILKILKKLSKEHLVLMVTHNEMYSKKYTDRIIKIKDGEIIEDTKPYIEEKQEEPQKLKKTSLPLLNAIKISLKNLKQKKARTLLLSFALSIGLIGIALVLSLSNGVNKFVDETEKEYMENYPISLYKEMNTLDFSINSINNKIYGEEGKINSQDDITNDYIEANKNKKYNNLIEFKKYIDSGILNKYIKEIKYNYSLEPQIYTEKYNKVEYQYLANSNELIDQSIFLELSNKDEIINQNYEILSGKIPQNKNEIALIISKENTINDSILYALDIKDKSELTTIYNQIIQNETIANKTTQYNYQDILNKKYKLILNTDYYKKEKTNYINKINDKNYMKKIIDDALEIKIVGLLKPKQENIASNKIAYRYTLTEYLINQNKNTKIGKEQLQNKKINIITNEKFDNIKNTYEETLNLLGLKQIEDPDIINIYPNNNKDKEQIIKEIEKYNLNKENKITYVDNIKELLKTITKIITIIKNILISFVTISLIVSSIMISIITYISVLERTKEIGILRSLGATKKDIKKIFNSETIIEGFIAGLIGIIITIIINKIINEIIYYMYNIKNISELTITNIIFLMILSITLTLISGMIPSVKASRKEPVKALKN